MKYDELLELEKDYTNLYLASASIIDCDITLIFSRWVRSKEPICDELLGGEYYPLTSSSSFLNDGKFEGRAFKRSTESHYLNHVRANSWVEDMHDKKLIHYRMLSSNDFIDAVTYVPPKIKLIQQMVVN